MRTPTTAILLAAALLAPVARAQAQEKPFAALSHTLLAGRDSLVRLAREQVGLRYRLGAVRPGLAFDCSGLVKWLLAAFDFQVPRTAAQQAKVGVAIPRDTAQLRPGDLLFFGRGPRVTHIGVYVGEGKYVHAANRRKGVIESEISRAGPTWWKGARRLLLEPDGSLSGTADSGFGGAIPRSRIPNL